MARIFRIARSSNVSKNLDDQQLEETRAAINEGRRLLADNPRPDTFAGRKTQEPFPKEKKEDV